MQQSAQLPTKRSGFKNLIDLYLYTGLYSCVLPIVLMEEFISDVVCCFGFQLLAKIWLNSKVGGDYFTV